MKKIKYFLLGIVGFFGLSFTFAIDSNYQIVHDIGTDSFNSFVQYGGNTSSANFCLYKNLTSLPFSFSVVTGCKPSGGSSTFYITQFGNAGFRVISRVDSSNILFDSNYDTTLFTITGSIGGPIVYDSINGGYLSFNRNTNSIILNGQEIWQIPSGSKSYSYGVGKAFSIMVLTGSQTGGYSDYFLNAYSDGLGNIVIDTGYMIVPIYDSQISSSLSGVSTLVITSNSDGRIIYNVYDVFSSNPNILVNGNIIDRGFGPTSWNFGKVNFMTGTKFSSSNSFTNLLTTYPYYFIYGIDSFYSPVYSVNVNSFDSSNKIFPVFLYSNGGFVSDSSVGNILGGNGGNNVEPIFDYNSYVINDLIVCYITSGEICSYNTFNRSAFESTFDVSDSVWNGTTGFLLGGNASLFLKEFCLNSSLIDYPYCSQLDLYSGSAIFIDYANGLLSYQILGDGIIVSIDGLGSGQLGNTSCWGGNCSSVNTGLPDFIHSSDSEYYSGSFIDTGYFEDFYNLSIVGFFMRCPFSYESNRVVIGQSVMNYLGGRDPFVFVNCMIAAFNEGKKFLFLSHIDFPGPLMSLTGNDYSPILGIQQVHNRKILFGFFDCLLSFGLLLLIRFFYRLFK